MRGLPCAHRGACCVMIRMLVGLGNPGPQYESTRHNAGFWWLDDVARQLGLTFKPDKNSQSQVARGTHQGEALWLVQPQTFMNHSGRAVAALARFYKIAPQDILVAHDELDLEPGEARLKQGGGHAGHNGLRDLHAQLGSDAYWRLRVGIGHPGQAAAVVGWVLQKPSTDHRIAIDQALDRAVRALPQILAGEWDAARQAIHTSKPQRPKPPRPATPDTPSSNGDSA